MSPPIRQRVLQGLDQLCRRIPTAYLRLPRSASGQPLSPFLQSLRYLRQLDERLHGRRRLASTTIREKFRNDMLSMRLGFPVGDVQDMVVSGENGLLPARLYKPSSPHPLPVLLVFFHGGGFVMGDLDTHDDACRLLCEASQMQILSVAYRLAPEHPFPAAVHDAQAAVTWALAQRAHFGVSAVAVGGDSAGGNLAAVTAQALANTDLIAQLLIYPSTDLVTPRCSHQQFGKGYFLNQTDRVGFYQAYLGDRHELRAHAQVSPLLNQQCEHVPPTLMVTAGFDLLCDEGIAYAQQLDQQGVNIEHLHFDRLGHAFINLAAVHAESKTALLDIAQHWHLLCQKLLTGARS